MNWNDEQKKFLKSLKSVNIPNYRLSFVPKIDLKSKLDFGNIPKEGGCYWIWTDEPILHSFHKHSLPKKFDCGEIIYNGIAKDNLSWRINNHLFSDEDEGWSGISIDLYMKRSISHRKKAMSTNIKHKVPYKDNSPLNDKSSLLRLRLSFKEKEYISGSNE